MVAVVVLQVFQKREKGNPESGEGGGEESRRGGQYEGPLWLERSRKWGELQTLRQPFCLYFKGATRALAQLQKKGVRHQGKSRRRRRTLSRIETGLLCTMQRGGGRSTGSGPEKGGHMPSKTLWEARAGSAAQNLEKITGETCEEKTTFSINE